MNIQGIVPAITAPLVGQSASNAAAAASSTSSSSNSAPGLSSSSLETTFLNLLVTELQNQDPTQPVDPTEMVGQMVSLNQLDQLISINQTLSSMSSGSSAAATGSLPLRLFSKQRPMRQTRLFRLPQRPRQQALNLQQLRTAPRATRIS